MTAKIKQPKKDLESVLKHIKSTWVDFDWDDMRQKFNDKLKKLDIKDKGIN